jgi:predicted nucleic acid-binding protein
VDWRSAQVYIANFRRWHPLATDIGMLEEASNIQARFRLNWWDCLIVAPARQNVPYLFTEDLQHGPILDGLVVVDPFQVSPDLIR